MCTQNRISEPHCAVTASTENLHLRLVVAALIVMMSGCATVVEREPPAAKRPATPPTPTPQTADAVPKAEPRAKYGNPESYVVFGKRYYTMKTAAGYQERGIASWYGKKFHGRKTSSGAIYDMYQMTAAHKALPLPTYVKVKNLDNGRTAVVKVNDRGPFHDNRIIDLSYAAALKLGITEKGTAFVEVTALNANGQTSVPPAPTPAAATRPDSSPPAPTSVRQGVYLQVGAFQDLANAKRLAARIEGVVSGSVQIRQVEVANGVIHRVQIGPIASVATADTIVAALDALGISSRQFIQ